MDVHRLSGLFDFGSAEAVIVVLQISCSLALCRGKAVVLHMFEVRGKKKGSVRHMRVMISRRRLWKAVGHGTALRGGSGGCFFSCAGLVYYACDAGS
jgi:hypothetical protein